MLVNLTPIREEQERRRGVAKEHDFEYIPQDDPRLVIEQGIYQSNFAYNFSEEEFEELQGLKWEDRYDIFPNHDKGTYGVADNIEQIKDYYRAEIEDRDARYAIAVTPVFQDRGNAGKGGGWRWHKWGEYIGQLDSKCEYLDDEDFGEDFEHVLVFEIFRVGGHTTASPIV
jgi:hypothetical protein